MLRALIVAAYLITKPNLLNRRVAHENRVCEVHDHPPHFDPVVERAKVLGPFAASGQGEIELLSPRH